MKVGFVCILPAIVLLAGSALSAPKKGADLWSLKPVVRPSIPSSATQSTNPIDAFIAAELKQRGLQPTRPADKLTLLRRASLDLTGLPATPAEQDAFLKDESPDAYEKVVDRLLSSEQHGVRYGRGKFAGRLPMFHECVFDRRLSECGESQR